MPKETPSSAPSTAAATPPPAAGDLAAENAILKARIAQFEAVKKQAEADEVIIGEKMARGLRREQAIAVIKRQREFEAARNQAAKK